MEESGVAEAPLSVSLAYTRKGKQMGWMKDAKAELAAKHAKRAAEEGHKVLVFLINVPSSAVQGTPVSGVAEQIEAVEDQGWALASLSAKDAKSMLALFRRGETAQHAAQT